MSSHYESVRSAALYPEAFGVPAPTALPGRDIWPRRPAVFIRQAQELGFSLDEVGELLKLEDGTHCSAARALGERKLADVQRRLADLRRIESVLKNLMKRCRSLDGRVRCPLIASLQEST